VTDSETAAVGYDGPRCAFDRACDLLGAHCQLSRDYVGQYSRRTAVGRGTRRPDEDVAEVGIRDGEPPWADVYRQMKAEHDAEKAGEAHRSSQLAQSPDRH
jgi:hypothetical protein